MNHCRCHDDAAMRMFAGAMMEAMTEHYLIFRKPRVITFLFWKFKLYDIGKVHIPKRYRDNYPEEKIRFYKDCVSLIDKGYTNGNVPEDLANSWRDRISEYQQSKQEVWE